MNDETDKDKTEEPYTGPERRQEHRRKGVDRRQEIRFEPGKEDRRKNPGRRKTDKDGNIWRTHDL